MRKIVQKVPTFGIVNGDTVRIALVDITGKECVTSSGYSFNQTITASNGKIEFEVMENDLIDRATKYKVFYPSITKSFTINHNSDETPHELGSLYFSSCVCGIVDVKKEFVDQSFLEEFDSMLSYGTPMNESFVRVYDALAYYADSVHDDEYMTVDTMKFLDSALSQYIAKEVVA